MKKLKVLVIPTTYPDESHPLKGIFFKNQTESLSKYVDVAVLDFELLSVKKLINFYNIKKYSYSIDNGVKTFRFREINYGLKSNLIINFLFKHHIYKCFNKIIKEFGMPDIIHAHVTYYGGYLAYLLSTKYNIPFIVTEHFSFLQKIVNTNPQICKSVFDNASKYLAVGENLKNEVITYGNRDCLMLPNYINMDKFKSQKFINSIKHNNKFNLLNISLLTEIKNISLILNALSLLIHENNIKDIHFHIVGDGPNKQFIKNTIKNLDITDYCTLHGAVQNDELIKYINSCDALVISSKKETFCMAGIEAMSCGLPVISTKCGGPESYINENTGILVENNDVESMKNGLIELINNYSKFDTIKIKTFIKDNFSEDVIIKKLISIYQEIK